MKPEGSTESNGAVLIAFGDLIVGSNVIKAEDVLRRLLSLRRWYTPRPSRSLDRGLRAIFYQNGTGCVAMANSVSVDTVDQDDIQILRELGIERFPVRLNLGGIHEFRRPVSLRPLVSKLDFITNKKYWGHNLRFTPIEISAHDAATILREVPSSGGDAGP